MKAKEIPANRLNYLRLLQAISRPELEVRELEALIKLIALDDFVLDDPRTPVAELADILKIDVQRTTPEERATLIQRDIRPASGVVMRRPPVHPAEPIRALRRRYEARAAT